MSTGLQIHTETMADWKLLCDQAAILVKTGFLPQSIKTPEQAVAIVLTGRELGIGMMAALNNINVIQGKPTVPPQLMLALINRSGQLEDMRIETGKDGATCMIKRRGQQPYTARFGPAEAAAMGLNGKDNYKKQPATMYKWRAVADAARVTFSDVLHGLYTPDEMDAQTDVETGEVITLEPVADEAPELGVHGITVFNEPEPVRPVKLEGAQPTSAAQWPKEKGIIGQIFAKCQALGWTPSQLANEIQRRFKASLTEDTVLTCLADAMMDHELKALDQALAGEFQNRNRTK